MPAAARFRAALLNTGSEAATLTIHTADGATLPHPVAAGALRYLDEALPTGETRLSGPPSLILAEPRLVRPSPRSRSLVLVLVDALRDDAVSTAAMPETLRRFAGGRRYLCTHANAPWTLPSLASAFTSTPPLELALPDGTLIAVPEGARTWAEALRGAGFSGGAVVANYSVHALNGFAAGFDTYLVPDGHGNAAPPDATRVAEQARAWLAAHRDEEAFLYLHLMDVHEHYRDRHGLGGGQEIGPLAHRERLLGTEESAALRRLYTAEVRYLDPLLAGLLGELPATATVALLADHGEALGEHGTWGHGLTVYQEALRVPLLLRGPRIAAGEEPRPVQLVDLAPTLLDALEVVPPPSFRGRSLLAGGSTLPIVSATFSAGPLRWSWIDGDTKVVLHAAPWRVDAAAAPLAVREGAPLPSGAWEFDLARDPAESDPRPLAALRAAGAARVLAGTAGRLATGLGLVVVGHRGEASVAVGGAVGLRPVQVFAPAPATTVAAGGRVELSTRDAYPFALALFAGDTPERVVPLTALPAWVGAREGSALPLLSLRTLPEPALAGAYLYWSDRPTLLQRGQDDTLRRLRNLGYLQ